MQVNGINSYSAPKMAFKGEGVGEKKGINKKAAIAAGVGAAAVAVGTTIYAFKKGKTVNGADGKLFKNIATGFQEIGKSIKKGIGKIFNKQTKETAKAEETLIQNAREAIVTTSDMAARDADLVERYGKNMSEVAYFHCL